MAAADKQAKVWESMIQSMTPKEREDPELLASTPSRRRRIARGSGRKEVDVSNMIARFSQMRSKMKDMSRMMNMSGAKGQLQSLGAHLRLMLVVVNAIIATAQVIPWDVFHLHTL